MSENRLVLPEIHHSPNQQAIHTQDQSDIEKMDQMLETIVHHTLSYWDLHIKHTPVNTRTLGGHIPNNDCSLQ